MALLLCPYCVTPVSETHAACPVCFEGLGTDALLEMDLDEWLGERRPCPSCLKAVHPLATTCPFCGRGARGEA